MQRATPAPDPLHANGLEPPEGFPVAPYVSIYDKATACFSSHPLFEHFLGAWIAFAYRFRATNEACAEFEALIQKHGPAPPPEERYEQEDALFRIHSGGFSTFECMSYGMFAIGGVVAPYEFSLASPQHQQRVSPTSTAKAYARAFNGDPICVAFAELFADPQYQQIREVRNVLTHRTAPGRRMYISFGDEAVPMSKWKLNDVEIDQGIATRARTDMSRLTGSFLSAAGEFIKTHL